MNEQIRFIGFWKRVWMSVIDITIYFIYFILVIITEVLFLRFEHQSDLQYIYFIITLLLIPITFTYFLWQKKGASLGKLVRKACIVDMKTGEPPTNKQLILRLIGCILSYFSFFLSYLHVGFDSRKQAWHDKLSNTAVIYSTDKSNYLSQINKPAQTKKDPLLLTFEFSIFSILFILLLIFVFFLFYDEPLKPEAEKWIIDNTITEKNPEQNGFYFLMGLSAKKDENPFLKGYELVDSLNHKNCTINDLIPVNHGKSYKDKAQNFKNPYEANLKKLETLFSNINESDILNYYVSKKTIIDSLVTSLDYLKERYKHISDFPYFEDTIISQGNKVEDYSLIITSVKRLNLAWIGKEYKIGNKQEALKELSDEIKCSRSLLSKSNTIILKTSGVLQLYSDLQLISEMIDESDSEIQHIVIPSQLDEFEADLSNAIINDFSAKVNSIPFTIYNDSINFPSNGTITDLIIKILFKAKFKRNKTINDLFSEYKIYYDFSQLSANEFHAQQKKILSSQTEFSLYNKFFNPVGQILVNKPLIERLKFSFHDLDCYINMLKLKLMIKKNHIKNQEIADYIKAQSDSLFNVYTREPFNWNQDKSVIFYNSQSKDKSISEVRIRF